MPEIAAVQAALVCDGTHDRPRTDLVSLADVDAIRREALARFTRRLVGSLSETPEPPPDEATRDALLRAFRELRGEP